MKTLPFLDSVILRPRLVPPSAGRHLDLCVCARILGLLAIED